MLPVKTNHKPFSPCQESGPVTAEATVHKPLQEGFLTSHHFLGNCKSARPVQVLGAQSSCPVTALRPSESLQPRGGDSDDSSASTHAGGTGRRAGDRRWPSRGDGGQLKPGAIRKGRKGHLGQKHPGHRAVSRNSSQLAGRGDSTRQDTAREANEANAT